MGLLSLAATMPVIALNFRAAPAAATPVAYAPEGQYMLTRELTRGLGNGKTVVVTRRWLCDFVSSESGIRVSGEQVHFDVEAPEVLAPIAEIERKRVVTGFLPATLDQYGRLTNTQQETADRDVRAAIDQALLLYKQKSADVEVQKLASEFLRDLSQAGAQMLSKVQPDLFFPEPGEHREDRTLELPNGDVGSFEVTLTAEAYQRTRLLKLVSRKVVTRIADSERLSSENWSMRPA